MHVHFIRLHTYIKVYSSEILDLLLCGKHLKDLSSPDLDSYDFAFYITEVVLRLFAVLKFFYS